MKHALKLFERLDSQIFYLCTLLCSPLVLFREFEANDIKVNDKWVFQWNRQSKRNMTKAKINIKKISVLTIVYGDLFFTMDSFFI